MKSLAVILVFAFATGASAPQFATAQITLQHQVLAVYPPQNATSVPIHDSLVVQFAPEFNILPQSLSDTTFVIQGQQSGWHRGTVTYDPQTHSATLKPVKPFFVGELVTAVATKFIQFDSVGEVKNIRGFAWQFFGKVMKATRATFSNLSRREEGSNVSISDIADLDGDTKPDIAAYLFNNATFLFNTGNGVDFDSVSSLRRGGALVADFNLDSRMDALIMSDSSYLIHFNPNRTFETGKVQNIWEGSEWSSVVDLNFDGHPEVVNSKFRLGSNSSDTLTIYEIRQDSIVLIQTKIANNIEGICSGDFNNDGAIDVIVASVSGIILFLNDGAGHLQDGITLMPSGPAPIYAADMDQDGWLDVTGPSGNGCTVLHNNHDLTFQKIYFNDGLNAGRLGFNIGDFDGDGRIDAVYTPFKHTTEGDSMFVYIAKNLGNNLFQLNQILTEGNSLGQYADIYCSDLTGDGAMDIAISFFSPGTILLLRNDSIIPPLAVVEESPRKFNSHELGYSFPNPTSGAMQISYWLASQQHVSIRILNTLGQTVGTVFEGPSPSGTSQVPFDCHSLPAQMYFIELRTPTATSCSAFQVSY